ncbi:hypothetical protein QCA50_008033 [Cerrena zonata]|uniref:Uncharacterized protein n=1 Tax=Cerrena zonata TaxID=2478898 RepID=A0AAW0GHS4_9APHY
MNSIQAMVPSIQHALLDTHTEIFTTALTLLLREDCPPWIPPPSDIELGKLVEIVKSAIANEFPSHKVTSMETYCHHGQPIKPEIYIHGRMVEAMEAETTSDQNRLLLKFMAFMIIVHHIGHASVNVAYNINPATKTTSDFPYSHCYWTSNREKSILEPGFSLEEAFLGGIVGAVFKEEQDGSPPYFLDEDLAQIDYLFIHYRDGSTYRLDPAMLESWLSDQSRILTEIDVGSLEKVVTPEEIEHRTCAFFAGGLLGALNCVPGGHRSHPLN